MEIVGEYSDEGHSGKNIKGRQEFIRMLNDIEDGKDRVDFVLVFKLSGFGRNAADVLSSLQLMQDYGVNLICVEDGIDSSKEAGKLENGEHVIAEDEVEIIQMIFDRYIHTNDGINGVANYADGHTIQYQFITGFDTSCRSYLKM